MSIQNRPRFDSSEEGRVVAIANLTLNKGVLRSTNGCLFITPKRLIFAPYLVKGRTILGFKDSTVEIPLNHIQTAQHGEGMLQARNIRIFIEPEYSSVYRDFLFKKAYFFFTAYGDDFRDDAQQAVSVIMRNIDACLGEADSESSVAHEDRTNGSSEGRPQPPIETEKSTVASRPGENEQTIGDQAPQRSYETLPEPASDSKRQPETPITYKKGNFIGQKYEVIRELGHGGFGIVYQVYSHETKLVYALKTFKDEFLKDTKERETFKREASVWIELERHPYIVQAYFVEELSGRLYIGMEYIAPDDMGMNTLQAYLQRQQPDLTQSLRWAIQFCQGMEYAYSKGVRCHRDIKPANIMISADKTVKITDFGLAAVLDSARVVSWGEMSAQDVDSILNLTRAKSGTKMSAQDGIIAGTPTHMPPEQFVNAAACDERSDIYAFGIVLYQMATDGKLPFWADASRDGFWNEMYLLHKHAQVPRFDSPLFSIVQRCLEKVPDRRYQVFVELMADLQQLLEAQTGEVEKLAGFNDLGAEELSNKGASLDSLGRYEEAIKCFDKALDINPQLEAVWSNKGTSLHSLGRYGKALECYDRALQINPQYAVAWVNKGFSLYSLGRYEEAIKCLDKALDIDPQYATATAWLNKGGSLGRLGRHDDAVRCFDKAIQIDPRYTEAWSNKGVCLNSLGRYAEAIECYDRALEINPQDAAAWSNKGNNLESLERFNEAIDCYDRALEIKPQNADAWKDKGISLARLSRFDEAMKYFDRALEINPQDAEALSGKGLSFRNLGRYDEAIKWYDKALDIDPQLAETWGNKGVALSSLGRYEKAAKCYEKALELNPQYTLAWVNKGNSLHKLSRYDEAMKYFDRALEINPRDAEAWNGKGACLRSLERYNEEEKCYNKALELNPQHHYAWLNKGAVLERFGRRKDAAACYRRFTELAPDQCADTVRNIRQRLRRLEGR